MEDESTRFSADLPMPGSAGPPGGSPVASVRDILLIRGDPGVDQGDRDNDLALLPRWEGSPASGSWSAPGAIDLGRGVRLETLEQDQAERLMNACAPRGHYFVPVRQFGQMYSLVRSIDDSELGDPRFVWDSDGALQDVLAMSRLVLDNSYSTDYSARIIEHADGEQQIMPAKYGSAPRTYRVRPQDRDWLTYDEVRELRTLLAAYWKSKEVLPDRVAHALWLSEYVVSVRWLDVIAPLVVVAFEALVNTGRQAVTRQFEERVPAITAEAGCPVSKSLCSNMYDTRSRWVHGNRVSLYKTRDDLDGGANGPTDDEERAVLDRIDALLRGLRSVLRKCIEDTDFRNHFSDTSQIRDRWPVSI